MAAPIKPQTFSVLQATAYWLVPTLTMSAPTKAEIESVSGLYITCFLTEENSGWTVQFNKGTGPRLLCNETTPEVLLPSSVTGTDLIGVVDPQAASGHDDKKAFEFLRNGFTGYMVRRHNKTNDTADTVTVGEFIDAAPVKMPGAVIEESATTAEGYYVFRTGVAVTGDPVTNIAVVGA